MKYKLIIFDIDGTITRHVSSWQLIHEKLNIWDDMAIEYQKRFLAGKISYKRFCELDAACWKGLPEENITNLFRPIAYTKNAKNSIKKLKKLGFKLAAVSTGLQYIGEDIRGELSLDYLLTNRLLAKKGILTGGVDVNIIHGKKAKAVKDIQSLLKVKPHETICIGDNEGDISLIKNAGYGIAFNSTSKALSAMADYDCKSKDFKEPFQRITDITFS